jgi:hypothetical protein
MTILQRRPDDFAHRNLFLQVTLGLVSCARRFDALLEAHALPGAGPPQDDAEPGDPLLFVLGLVAFRSRLMAAVEAIPLPPVPPPRPPSAHGFEDPRR